MNYLPQRPLSIDEVLTHLHYFKWELELRDFELAERARAFRKIQREHERHMRDLRRERRQMAGDYKDFVRSVTAELEVVVQKLNRNQPALLE